MTASNADNIANLDLIKARGADIRLCSADPGTAGSNMIATTPTSVPTVWAASAMGSGPDAGYAVAPGAATDFTLPASTTATHFAVFSGTTYLRGYPLDAALTSNAQPVPVTFTPRLRFKG